MAAKTIAKRMVDCIEEFLDVPDIGDSEAVWSPSFSFEELDRLFPLTWSFVPICLSPLDVTTGVMANMSNDPFNTVEELELLTLENEKSDTSMIPFLAFFWTQGPENCKALAERLCCISSPQRNLVLRPPTNTATSTLTSSSASNYSNSETTMCLFDFLCGVEDAHTFCQTNITCKAHSVHEKLQVVRSKPLNILLTYRTRNKHAFNKNYRLVLEKLRIREPKRKVLTNKNHHLLNRAMPRTIRQKSPRDLSHEDSWESTSSLSVSSSQRLSRSEKERYLKELSLASSFRIKETVAYLHYRLQHYEYRQLQARINEFTNRSKENSFSTNSNYI